MLEQGCCASACSYVAWDSDRDFVAVRSRLTRQSDEARYASTPTAFQPTAAPCPLACPLLGQAIHKASDGGSQLEVELAPPASSALGSPRKADAGNEAGSGRVVHVPASEACLQNERDDTVDDLVRSDHLHEPGVRELGKGLQRQWRDGLRPRS